MRSTDSTEFNLLYKAGVSGNMGHGPKFRSLGPSSNWYPTLYEIPQAQNKKYSLSKPWQTSYA